MKSLQGHLLAASPHLHDPNFTRTVILLIQHTKEGAFGVVLNRRIDKTIQQLWEEVHEPPCENTKYLNLGGPVSGPLMAIHTRQPLAELEVVSGIYFSAQKEHLEELVQQPDLHLKLFVGHSGWGGGQLENELQQGAWFTVPATAEYIFHDEDELWTRVTRYIGTSLLASALKIKHLPQDPTTN